MICGDFSPTCGVVGFQTGAFDHPKTTVFCGDGMEYMRKHENYFDVIITDSSGESKLALIL